MTYCKLWLRTWVSKYDRIRIQIRSEHHNFKSCWNQSFLTVFIVSSYNTVLIYQKYWLFCRNEKMNLISSTLGRIRIRVGFKGRIRIGFFPEGLIRIGFFLEGRIPIGFFFEGRIRIGFFLGGRMRVESTWIRNPALNYVWIQLFRIL